MNLYLVRHADAVANDDDSIRALSDYGRAQVAQLVRTFESDARFRPDEFWHSSLLRARETAELLQTGLKLNVPLRQIDGITPEDDPRIFVRKLEKMHRATAVVGHEPFLGLLAALLVGPKGPAYFAFHKAEILALEKKSSGWTMSWRVIPENV